MTGLGFDHPLPFMRSISRWPVLCAALLLAGVAGSSAASLPETAPDYVAQLPPGQWVVAPDPARPCAGFCEAASYQPPFRIYVRETRTEKWGNQTTVVLGVDGCLASSDGWKESTGFTVAQRVNLVRTSATAAAAGLAEYCRLTSPPKLNVEGVAAMFERFDQQAPSP